MDSAKLQRRVATIIRQYFRAVEANDVEAVSRESVDLCCATSWLLEHHLKSAPNWNSDERWLDGMIASKVADLPENTVQIEGEVVWGLSENPGGKQWSEPLLAQIRATDSGLEEYEIGFGRGSDEESPEIEFGFYPTLGATVDQHHLSDGPSFRFVFRGGASHKLNEANRVPVTD